MAKGAPTYREIMKDIKSGKFAPIYILMGEETYYIDKIVEALEKSVVPADEKDFNEHIYYGADADIDTVIGAARQFPMMSEHQLVMLKEAQSLERAKVTIEKLEPYMRHPVKSTVFVVAFKSEPIGARSEMLKSAKAHDESVVFTSNKLRDKDMTGPIIDYCTEKGVRMDAKAIEMLVEHTGAVLSKAFGEIDKLIVATKGEAKVLTADHVTTNIGVSKDYNAFELTDALETRNFKKAMTIVDYYAKNNKKNPVVSINPFLFSFFTRLSVANFLKDQSDGGLMKAFPTFKSPYALGHLKKGMASYPGMRPLQAIHVLRELDVKCKGVDSTQNEHQLLKEALFKIFTL